MKIRSRLLLVLVTATILVCALLRMWGAELLGRSVRESSIHRLDRELAAITSQLSADLDSRGLLEFATSFGEQLGLRVTLIADDGSVLADSSVAMAEMDNHGGRPEVVAALESGHGESFRKSDTNEVEYYYRAARVERGRVGVVRIALKSEDLEQFRVQFLLLLLAGILGALCLLGGVGWYTVGRLARPVERVTRYAERVASGALDTEAPAARGDELDRLTTSVERMRESLLSRVEEMEIERGLFRAMTDGLDEGLVLTDSDQSILLVNDAFRKIFRVESNPIGRRLDDVVRNLEIIRHLETCLSDGRDVQENVDGPEGTNRSFELHVSRVALPEGRSGVLAMMFDVTRQEALEQVRQRFIADVSHELRTPVTSIKGAVETLLDSGGDIDETGRRFLEIARRQADRMSELIADLADLSRIETGAIEFERGDIDLSALIRDVVEVVTSRHGGRDVTLKDLIPEGYTVFADRRRLEQVLVNLIDNAMKYTPDGGTVRLTADRANGYDILTVEDTGPGIPADDREKVFNRFYRVDKARSRELGGTGLGLAIVKHLVKQHEGMIRVASGETGGARFVLELPVG